MGKGAGAGAGAGAGTRTGAGEVEGAGAGEELVTREETGALAGVRGRRRSSGRGKSRGM